MDKLAVVVILCALPFSAMSKPELKGNPEDLRQFLHSGDKVVTIHGESEKKAYSDKAIVSLVITTEDKLLSDSISANSDLRQSITKKLSAAGIPVDGIKNSKFSTSPQYGWFGKKPDSYKVVNRMAISIVEESQLKEIAMVADTYKEVELSDTSFEHTKKDEYNNQVKIDALNKIMQQKAFYEKTLGIKLTPVGFKDINVQQRATRGAKMIEEVIVTAQKKENKSYSSSRYQHEPQEPSFDEIKYAASLSVDFKIEDRLGHSQN